MLHYSDKLAAQPLLQTAFTRLKLEDAGGYIATRIWQECVKLIKLERGFADTPQSLNTESFEQSLSVYTT